MLYQLILKYGTIEVDLVKLLAKPKPYVPLPVRYYSS
jgi:hypothetical protein